MEEELFETIMFVLLILMTGLALGLLFSGAGQKPSLERSRELYWRSIVVFTFGLILTVMWYLFGIGLSESEEYLSQMGITLGVSLVALLTGLNHWRKFRKFSRASLEIEQRIIDDQKEE